MDKVVLEPISGMLDTISNEYQNKKFLISLIEEIFINYGGIPSY